jgi:uncharacterized protein (DUF1800 family)
MMTRGMGIQVARVGALAIALGLATSWAAAQTITSFTVVNADTGADITTVTSAATVSLTSTPRINVRANVSGTRSVAFVDASSTRIENTAPYAYKGNAGSAYLPWSPAAGNHVFRATPYAASRGTGSAGTTATLTLTVTGTATPPPPPPPAPITRNEAARFLAQATFGPTDADIERLRAIGYAAWIDEQLALPGSNAHQACLDAAAARGDGDDKDVVACFWRQAFTGRDQLRLRMAYALSQIFVISLADGDVDNFDRGVAAWIDQLAARGFGNYRDLLQYASLNPLMGLYLSHLANQRADVATGRVPDENYAREVMQLFSIGLVELNPDGRPRTGANGAGVETYTPADVSELAKVFTGWSWACPAPAERSCFLRGENNGRSDPDRALKPMIAYPAYHSPEAKTFLGLTIPAQTGPAESLRLALDRLAAHPNVGPFIGRQLIQRFTTSNPSPAYVQAVASAFANNGAGVRGDLGAVLKAVLMHPEARAVTNTSGKVREPVLRLSAFVRAFPHRSVSGHYDIELTDNPATALAQAPMVAPSVFNFYRPGYVAPGTQSAARQMVAPELQIANETSVAGYVNFMRDSISQGVGFPAGAGLTRRDLRADYAAELALANDVPRLVEHVVERLTYGAMGAARRAEIASAVGSIAIPAPTSSASQIEAARRARVHAAILLTVAAPEFAVLK